MMQLEKINCTAKDIESEKDLDLCLNDEEIQSMMGISSHGKEKIEGLKTIILDCPGCSLKSKVTLNEDEFVESNKKSNGISNVIVDLPCNHIFVFYIDSGFKIRGYTRINDEINVTVEKVDDTSLREWEKKLKDLHGKLNAVNDPRTYKVFQELIKIRKELKKQG